MFIYITLAGSKFSRGTLPTMHSIYVYTDIYQGLKFLANSYIYITASFLGMGGGRIAGTRSEWLFHTFLLSLLGVTCCKSGWHSVWFDLGLVRGLWLVDLNLTLRVFLRVLRKNHFSRKNLCRRACWSRAYGSRDWVTTPEVTSLNKTISTFLHVFFARTRMRRNVNDIKKICSIRNHQLLTLYETWRRSAS